MCEGLGGVVVGIVVWYHQDCVVGGVEIRVL